MLILFLFYYDLIYYNYNYLLMRRNYCESLELELELSVDMTSTSSCAEDSLCARVSRATELPEAPIICSSPRFQLNWFWNAFGTSPPPLALLPLVPLRFLWASDWMALF